MTEKEYNEKIEFIKNETRIKEHDLMVQYAMDQVKFKVGDIIQSSAGTIIRVGKIDVFKGLEFPCPRYIGYILKKDLTPEVDKEVGIIYENENIKLLKI